MIKSIFYTRFHPEKGPTVLHQVPEGSVIPCPPSPTAQTPLFDFASISDYLIPRREFCDRLVAVCVNRHRVLGYPVCIHDDTRYERNEFIFNFSIVLEEDVEYSAYASVVRKLARLFRNLEEQGGFLSKEEGMEGLVIAGMEGYGGRAKVYALCEMIQQDLNNYCECMIPIDESNTLNLKLFPTRPPPAPVHGWHVPLSTVRLSSLQTSAWDLTLQKIIPHINGVNTVVRIAMLADTDFALTRKAVSHLLYYGCMILLDVFQFGAIYAPTADIGAFFADDKMQEECRRYIAVPYTPFSEQPPPLTAGFGGEPSTLAPHVTFALPARSTLLHLYSTLRQGLTLKNWCMEHSADLGNIDVRRLITFGVIKGFLYRVHRYAIAAKPYPQDASTVEEELRVMKQREKLWRAPAMSSGWMTPTEAEERAVAARDAALPGQDKRHASDRGSKSKTDAKQEGMETKGADLPLARFLDGTHCLDEICAELRLSEKEVTGKLTGFGDVLFVHR
ncbi:Nitrogen permease regulator 2 [Elasticomyces elasticus]|nr:Nitrogen permease regulator 2 [Elasticomyces elasticus]KAK4996451.1 Nitrogen permease regulator 2 [Elasticomyces elasticus]